MTGNKHPVTTRDTVPKRRGCFRCRSASTAGQRQLGTTCELQLLGRFNRTRAAGLRHSARPANCKRGPLTWFEVPNVGHPFPFLLFFFFPFSTFVVSESHFPFAQPEAFSNPQGRSAAAFLSFLLLTFQFFDYALRLHSQPPALLQNLSFSFSVCLVWQPAPAPLLCKVPKRLTWTRIVPAWNISHRSFCNKMPFSASCVCGQEIMSVAVLQGV